jgi:hypothetical protein
MGSTHCRGSEPISIRGSGDGPYHRQPVNAGRTRRPRLSDPDCDGVHFTHALVRIIAPEFYNLIVGTTPIEIQLVSSQPDGRRLLTWTGGSGPFQLERSTNLQQWVLVGDVTLGPGEFEFLPDGSHEFFRVLSLGQ